MLGRTIVEVDGNMPVGQLAVTGEHPAELHPIFHSFHEQLPKHGAIDGVVTLNRVVQFGVHDVILHTYEDSQVLIEERESAVGFSCGGEEIAPGRLGEEGMQRTASGRVDVDAIALEAGVPSMITLEDRDVDADAAETLGEGEAADPASDDSDVQLAGRRVRRAFDVRALIGHAGFLARWWTCPPSAGAV